MVTNIRACIALLQLSAQRNSFERRAKSGQRSASDASALPQRRGTAPAVTTTSPTGRTDACLSRFRVRAL